MRSDATRVAERARRRLAALAQGAALPGPEAEPAQGPRALLARHLGVGAGELAVLDLCVAVQVDTGLEALVAEAQGRPWRPAPTEALALRLAGLPSDGVWRPTSALARWRLLDEIADPGGAAPVLRADPRVTDWYRGRLALSAELVDAVGLIDAEAATLPGWDMAAEARLLSEVMQSGGTARVRLVGVAGSGRRLAAATLLRALGLPGLEVDGAALPGPEAVIRLYRFAILSGRVPVWTSPPAAWPPFRTPPPLQVVLSEDAADAREGDLVIAQPGFDAGQRQTFWLALGGPAPLPMPLAQATPAELVTIAPLAAAGPASVPHYLRQRALTDLDAIGSVRHAQLGWDDIVLPDEVTAQLADYAAEARLRVNLLARREVRRLFAADAAPTALFTGPPGVGKTMAAECIGAELDLPLLVIDVARTVSKYIGETAKNLSAIMDRARRYGCLLFFDEADAFFARRTDLKDSNDRHANADTNHLLQLIERYEGPVILSTNKPGNMDEAFFRRIRHVIDFHRPDTDQRRALWDRFAGVLAGRGAVAALDAPLRLCAERFELTPAQIKGAVLTAHFDSLRAGSELALAHLLNGVARELRKEGRSLPADLTLSAAKGGAHVA